jgi:deazaflavin-dependent oxidoreductase (nitroreductase family)
MAKPTPASPRPAGNRFIAALLQSPLHPVVSGNMMLLTVAGRKTGRPITTPVNYVRQAGALSVISFRDRTWWRNARGGSPVTLRLQGRDARGRATVIEDEAGVAAALEEIARLSPRYARFLKITLDAHGRPAAGDAERAAHTRVVIRITLEA